MSISRSNAILLGILTAWPIAYSLLFLGFLFSDDFSEFSDSSKSPPTMFSVLLPLHVITMIVMTTLMVIYIVHLFKTESVAESRKYLWVVVLVFGNVIAMPVFWYLYIWSEPKNSTPEI